jgi:hypothetical protein
VSYTLGDREFSARLVRSSYTDTNAVVELPSLPNGWTATLHWRRYPTKGEYTVVPMLKAKGVVGGLLPIQPAAGKMEYYLRFAGPEGAEVRVPSTPADDPVIRYKDPVPAIFLVLHVAAMFLAMMIAVRAALAAVFRLREVRTLAWVALGGLVVGGLVLGPIVQKYAFGAFWTGWPNGYDLTDNKSLVMCVAWGIACVVLGYRSIRRPRAGRLALILAGLIVLVVYVIPHSLRGSELDYGKLDQGIPAEDAIETG